MKYTISMVIFHNKLLVYQRVGWFTITSIIDFVYKISQVSPMYFPFFPCQKHPGAACATWRPPPPASAATVVSRARPWPGMAPWTLGVSRESTGATEGDPKSRFNKEKIHFQWMIWGYPQFFGKPPNIETEGICSEETEGWSQWPAEPTSKKNMCPVVHLVRLSPRSTSNQPNALLLEMRIYLYAIICNHCKYSHVLTKDSNGVGTWIQTTLCTTVTNEKKCVSLEIHQMRSVNKICWKKLERLSTGWCLGHPSEKYEFVSWDD